MSLFTLISGSGLLSDPFSVKNPEAIILFGIKAMFVVGGILYLLFAFLVTRQISIMSSTVQTTASLTIKLLGYLHLLISILVLMYFFTVL